MSTGSPFKKKKRGPANGATGCTSRFQFPRTGGMHRLVASSEDGKGKDERGQSLKRKEATKLMSNTHKCCMCGNNNHGI